MNCIRLIRSEHARLKGRMLSAAPHLAVIEEALHYVSAPLSGSGGFPGAQDRMQLRAACTDALGELADLRAPSRLLP